MIKLDTLEKCVILQVKQQQGDVLEQDTALCPFCYFPVTIRIGGQEEANCLWKFIGFHTFIVCSFCFEKVKTVKVALSHATKGLEGE
jgi:hypothetical protein